MIASKLGCMEKSAKKKHWLQLLDHVNLDKTMTWNARSYLKMSSNTTKNGFQTIPYIDFALAANFMDAL